MALVVGGVVDQDVDSGVGGEDLMDSRFERVEIGDVAMNVVRLRATFRRK
jgi:hypothetical protein